MVKKETDRQKYQVRGWRGWVHVRVCEVLFVVSASANSARGVHIILLLGKKECTLLLAAQ